MLKVLADGLNRLRAAWPVNRVVTVLTPLVFAPAAGAGTAWLAANFPGLPQITSAQATAAFIAGATIAFGKAYKWLDGWQKQEHAMQP